MQSDDTKAPVPKKLFCYQRQKTDTGTNYVVSRATYALAIIAASRSAVTTIRKSTRVNGKHAKNVARILTTSLKCMCGMERMSTILKNWRTLQSFPVRTAPVARK